jgi:hypothetical protein
MELLRHADELREPAEYFDEVPTAKPQKDMVDLAVQLMAKKIRSIRSEEVGGPLRPRPQGPRTGEDEGARNSASFWRQGCQLDGSPEAQHRGCNAREGQSVARRDEAGLDRSCGTEPAVLGQRLALLI